MNTLSLVAVLATAKLRPDSEAAAPDIDVAPALSQFESAQVELTKMKLAGGCVTDKL